VVVVNVGHPRGSQRLERVLASTMGAVFTTVLRDPVEPTNALLVATGAPATGARLRTAAATLPPGLRPLALGTASRLRPAPRGERAYTDDRAPVEWLVDSSIVEYAARGGEKR
jgi:hypothetical protein